MCVCVCVYMCMHTTRSCFALVYVHVYSHLLIHDLHCVCKTPDLTNSKSLSVRTLTCNTRPHKIKISDRAGRRRLRAPRY